jgi:hypothetical protein
MLVAVVVAVMVVPRQHLRRPSQIALLCQSLVHGEYDDDDDDDGADGWMDG